MTLFLYIVNRHSVWNGLEAFTNSYGKFSMMDVSTYWNCMPWALYLTTCTTLQCHLNVIATTLDHRESLLVYYIYILIQFLLYTLRHTQWYNNVENTKIGIHVSHTCHIILTACFSIGGPSANLHTNQKFHFRPKTPLVFWLFFLLSSLTLTSLSILDFWTLLL